METIIAAAISAVTTLVVCLVNNRAQHAKTTALLEYKFSQLDKKVDKLDQKVDKHNQVIERTYILEGKMREAEHDIEFLKEYHKPGA
jgi:outer membrane murein-binding lipoprotein Lpp